MQSPPTNPTGDSRLTEDQGLETEDWRLMTT